MMNPNLRKRYVACLLISALAIEGVAVAETQDDRAAVRALATRQADAWNRHDAKAYANLFALDCDFVNVVGWWWNGRDELERKLAASYTTMFKDSVLTFTDVQVRFLTPQVAIAHMRWAMTGTALPAEFPQPKQGIQTLVARKQGRDWMIDVFQNTNTIVSATSALTPSKASAGVLR